MDLIWLISLSVKLPLAYFFGFIDLYLGRYARMVVFPGLIFGTKALSYLQFWYLIQHDNVFLQSMETRVLVGSNRHFRIWKLFLESPPYVV